MVMDFAHLDADVKSILDTIDHQDLNLVLPADYQPPTAEHLAQYLFNSIPVNLWGIKVWETRNSFVEISR
jgi:6-pyruvoyl-tetrahydropterin synthase